jgi:hypothetical protein
MIKKIVIKARELEEIYRLGKKEDKDFKGYKIKREKQTFEIRKMREDFVYIKGGYQEFEIRVSELLAAVNAILEYGEPIKLRENKKSNSKIKKKK